MNPLRDDPMLIEGAEKAFIDQKKGDEKFSKTLIERRIRM